MGVKFRDLPTALYWRAPYPFKSESLVERTRTAASRFLDLFLHLSVTQIRGS